ncbi:MAG: hypothetical protein P4L96_10190 [Rhodoferax sp.]|nr:hypothetical protein [Rhodoferax sp.]
MASTIYAVDNELYCFWSNDLCADALTFLDSVDAGYFAYVADEALKHLGDETTEMRAATNLRIAFFHGLESLLMLIAAAVQAPKCPQAYLGQCTNDALRSLLKKIDEGAVLPQYNRHLKVRSWPGIAEEVLRCTGETGAEQQRLVGTFANLWADLASKQRNQVAIWEYNSLKHGFRIQPGGFTLKIEANGPNPSNPLELTIGEKFGTGFQVLTKPGDDANTNRSRVTERHNVIWRVEDLAHLVYLISASLRNVVTYLRVYNGGPPPYVIARMTESAPAVPRSTSTSISLAEPVPGARPTTKVELEQANQRNQLLRENRSNDGISKAPEIDAGHT